MAKNNVVSFMIRAKDHTTAVLKRIGAGISGLAKGILHMGADLNGWSQMIGNAVGKVKAAFAGLYQTIQVSFRFEALTKQFRPLLGSMEAAEKRMEELADFANHTPFDLAGVAKASKLLTLLSNGAMGGVGSLTAVGNAASVAGAQIEEVAMWVGRAYDGISNNRPVGEAMMRLTELGIVSGKVRGRIEELQAAGASSVEVWRVLQEQLNSFSGAMDEASRTGEGLTSTLGDSWTNALKHFGDVFREDAKDVIESFIGYLDRLAGDGTIEQWAKKAQAALAPLKDLIVAITGAGRAEGLQAAWDALRAVWDYALDMMRIGGDYIADKISDAIVTPKVYIQRRLADIQLSSGKMMLKAREQAISEGRPSQWRQVLEEMRTAAYSGIDEENERGIFSKGEKRRAQKLKEAQERLVANTQRAADNLKDAADRSRAHAADDAHSLEAVQSKMALKKKWEEEDRIMNEDLRRKDEARKEQAAKDAQAKKEEEAAKKKEQDEKKKAEEEKEKAAKKEKDEAKARIRAAEAKKKAAERAKQKAERKAANDAIDRDEKALEKVQDELKALEGKQAEIRKRALSVKYDRQARKEEREKAKEDKRFLKKRLRLLDKVKENRWGDFYSKDFDVRKLSHAERRVREALIAKRQEKAKEAQAKKLEDNIQKSREALEKIEQKMDVMALG